MRGIISGNKLVPLDLEMEVILRRNNVARKRREQQEVQTNQGEREPLSSISSSSFPVINPHPNFEERIMAKDRPQRVTLEDYSSFSIPQYFTGIA